MQAAKQRIIAFSAHKGGVGKTTLSSTLAAGLANQGARVAWVDLDAQGQCALWFGLPQAPGLYNMLVGGETAESQLIEVPRDRWSAVADSQGHFFLLPGDRSNQGVWDKCDDAVLLRDKLAALVIGGVVDYVLLDTPPSISEDVTVILLAAGLVIIPTKPSYLAVQGVVQTLETIQNIEEETTSMGPDRAEVGVLGIVPNLYNSSRSLHQQNVEALRARWGEAVWPVVNDFTVIEEAPQEHKSIFVYAPQSNGYERAVVFVRAFNNRVEPVGV